jgi:ABC-type oligopeptide transport system ATPase subunit
MTAGQAAPELATLLEVRDLCVSYGTRRHQHDVLRDVNLSVASRETVAVVGESGAGKSTLGRAILGLVPVRSGAITFDGQDITRAGRSVRRALSGRLQAVFQDPYSSLNPTRTIGETLVESLLTSHANRADRLARAGEVLQKVGLPADAVARYPSAFSGGQRQRIAIARALMPSPELIVMDEALSSLDLSLQAQIINLLTDLRDEFGVALLFIGHDLTVVRHLAHRVLVLYRGDAVEFGSAADVYETPTAEYTRTLLAAAPVPDPARQRLRRRTENGGSASASASPLPEAGESGRRDPPARLASETATVQVTANQPADPHEIGPR